MSDTFNLPLSEVDPEVAAALEQELGRQRDTLEMIASENFVPRAVLEAQGSVLTNKYAEGYPGRRYYGGCEFVDIVETLAIERAKALFGSEFANVQSHSGASANAAVLAAIATPGDRILGIELAHGGHLTHGMKLNFSGKLYEPHAYGVDPETSRVDMDVVRGGRSRCSPRCSSPAGRRTRASSTSPRSARSPTRWARKLWVDMAHFAGLVAAGLHPTPVPHAHVDVVDRAQDDRRTALRLHPDQRRGPREEDQLERLPRPAGRSAHARHRREGDGVQARRRRPSSATVRSAPCAAPPSSPSV